jgi:hypothetical protein
MEPNEPRPPRQDNAPIASEQLNSDRKRFFIDLKENARGRVYVITEDVEGRRNRIMLPAGASREFVEALQRMVAYEATLDQPS